MTNSILGDHVHRSARAGDDHSWHDRSSCSRREEIAGFRSRPAAPPASSPPRIQEGKKARPSRSFLLRAEGERGKGALGLPHPARPLRLAFLAWLPTNQNTLFPGRLLVMLPPAKSSSESALYASSC